MRVYASHQKSPNKEKQPRRHYRFLTRQRESSEEKCQELKIKKLIVTLSIEVPWTVLSSCDYSLSLCILIKYFYFFWYFYFILCKKLICFKNIFISNLLRKKKVLKDSRIKSAKKSNMKTFSTTTSAFLVWILENEFASFIIKQKYQFNFTRNLTKFQ